MLFVEELAEWLQDSTASKTQQVLKDFHFQI